MRLHLYHTKKPCPAINKDIELTNDIKDFILVNRVYHPKDETKIMNQTINNFIANMSPIIKLNHLVEHENIEIVDFEDHVEKVYEKNQHRLLNNSYKNTVEYSKSGLMNMVYDITKINGVENMNFIYDSALGHVYFYTGSEWEPKRFNLAIEYLVETLVIYHLSYYEFYLIRKIDSGEPVQEHLETYYRFIACFDINPVVKGKNDTQILYNEDDERYDATINRFNVSKFSISDRFQGIFTKVRETLTDSQKRETIREITDIMKSNHMLNIMELNKHVLEVLQVDQEFKARIGI